jgi:hypothetical protein
MLDDNQWNDLVSIYSELKDLFKKHMTVDNSVVNKFWEFLDKERKEREINAD